MSSIYQIYGSDAHDMTLQLMQAADVASRIPAGASIALKPNLVVAAHPDTGATTHAGVLSGAIEYLQQNGFADISVIEGSWVGDRTERAYRVCGYDQVLKAYNVPFYDLKRDETVQVQTKVGPVAVCRRAYEADYLIDLPVLKGHCQTVMTCALKNLKGCISDKEKRHFHTLGLNKPIGALAAALKPHLIIVDSICGDLDFEEGGTPVQTNRMMLGFDAVQMDAYGCRLLGIPTSDVPYIAYAEKWGAGSSKIGEVISLNQPQAEGSSARPSGTVAMLTRGVHQDRACSACFASLVRALHVTGAGRSTPIYIGQGWQSKQVEGLGVGRCAACASMNIPGCPPTAEAIAAFLTENDL
ncbi:MAG: DUF362 domain-containing protein [Eubacteriales bacterium]|nr:DUF362 domain-containing protein [Eubacteriales bacterium]